MRTLLRLFAMAGMVGSALAQGTVIFSNLSHFATTADRLVRGPDGAPLVGTDFVAQLYYGPTPENLRLVTNAPARFRVPTTSYPGTWSLVNGTRLIGFDAGDTLWLQVRVWNSTLFPDHESPSQVEDSMGELSLPLHDPFARFPSGCLPHGEFRGIRDCGHMDCGQGWLSSGSSDGSLVLSSGPPPRRASGKPETWRNPSGNR